MGQSAPDADDHAVLPGDELDAERPAAAGSSPRWALRAPGLAQTPELPSVTTTRNTRKSRFSKLKQLSELNASRCIPHEDIPIPPSSVADALLMLDILMMSWQAPYRGVRNDEAHLARGDEARVHRRSEGSRRAAAG